jgi:hypothetical protein
LLADLAAQIERNNILRAESFVWHTSNKAASQKLRAANRVAMEKAAALMVASRQLGTIAKAERYPAERAQKKESRP